MKQILQNIANGETSIVDAPSPQKSSGYVIIKSSCSLISAGTERMLVEFSNANWIVKARQQPEKVKMVLDKVKTDGLLTTVEAVQSKLKKPLPMGYCHVGEVLEVGTNVTGFKPGDRVASNGSHADVVKVPKNLCALIPDNVDDESAAFTVVASIGLQGIRLINPTLGESVVVTGVGLIGLLTVQLLKAQGCRVLAIDFDEKKLELARQFGAEICNPGKGEDPVAAGLAFSRSQGVDAVIITASTDSSEPVTQAARMSRKRGRIVLVGVTGLQLNRSDFYEKELSFQVSCSYGPGRYDSNYEEKGQDYPQGFVRWTEQRNFEAVLEMMSTGKLDVKTLISHSFDFAEATKAYEVLSQDKNTIGILLKYNSAAEQRLTNKVILNKYLKFDPYKPSIGFIGAGNYASRMLIPAFKNAGAQLRVISTSGGINSVIHGKSAGFAEASTDTQGLLDESEVNTVVVVTRHDSHAGFVVKALEKGKNVFVEKPLAINEEQLTLVEAAYNRALDSGMKPHLMVGFNRRFSPQVQKMKELLYQLKGSKSFIMTMNAGAIPASHWTQDLEIGGGRIIGEACHYIDLMRFLAGSEIISVNATKIGKEGPQDNACITLGFTDGSAGTIHYFSNGAANFPKERVEVFCEGKVLQLDNFRKLSGFGWSNFKKMNLWRQDKGQMSCVAAFLSAIENGQKTPISPDEIFEVARVSIQAAELLRLQ